MNRVEGSEGGSETRRNTNIIPNPTLGRLTLLHLVPSGGQVGLRKRVQSALHQCPQPGEPDPLKKDGRGK